MSVSNVFKSIKLLSDLTKKQKNKYLQDNGYYYQSKYGYENLFIKYAIDNNQYDNLKTWYENCTYSSPDYIDKINLKSGEIINNPTHLSVYVNNRFHEFFNGEKMNLKK